MRKQTAIEMLGGTPKKAAHVMGYTSAHAVYMWPDPLPQSMADKVRGAAARLYAESAEKQRKQPTKEVA